MKSLVWLVIGGWVVVVSWFFGRDGWVVRGCMVVVLKVD